MNESGPDGLLQLLSDLRAATLDPDERTCLVVDDDPDLREWLCSELRAEGLDVRAAAAAGQALELVASLRPRVAIVDRNLPDFEGLELIRRGRPRSPDTAFILLTGAPTLESAIEALNLGAFAYLTKPVLRIGDVTSRVFAAIERRRVEAAQRLLASRLAQVEAELASTRIERDAMSDVARESLRDRARTFRDFLDEVVEPLRTLEAELLRTRATGGVSLPGLDAGTDGRLPELAALVRRVERELTDRAAQLARDAGDAPHIVAP